MRERVRKTDTFTLKSGHLPVGSGHKIWYESWGNPKAKIPVLFFHGGPGGQFKSKHKYGFDPKVHHVIGFDQRGSGNSLPYGKLEHNTTEDLLTDSIKLLKHLGVKRVYIEGGSWGSTLALLFSMTYPEVTVATIIRGVFTGTKKEIDYIDKGYFQNFYPEVWERFVASVPAAFKDEPGRYHYDVLRGTKKKDILASAKALEDLERPLLGFNWQGYSPDYTQELPDTDSEYDYVPYQIYAHYMDNACFLEDDYIIKNAKTIKTPLHIVQGRYDMVCPPVTAYKIHSAVSHSKLFMTLGSHGHDPENKTALDVLRSTVFM